jgi:hypothetical protein
VKPRSGTVFAYGIAVAIAAVAITTSASAQEVPAPAVGNSRDAVDVCINAFESGQVAERRSKLISAREIMAQCMSASCPGTVRSECDPLLQDITRRIPSVLIACTKPGAVLSSYGSVTIDGKQATISGTALELDPGEHVFVLSSKRGAGASEPQTQTQTLRRVVSERERGLRIEFACVDPPKPRPVAVTLSLLGVSALSLGSFAYFGLTGLSRKNDLESCKGACENRLVDNVQNRFIAADISVGVSALALGLASFIWFSSAGSSSKTSSATRVPLGFSF